MTRAHALLTRCGLGEKTATLSGTITANALAHRDARPKLAAMVEFLPASAKTLELPYIGKVVLYRHHGEWVAVRPDFESPARNPVGAGASPGEAVAELVAQEH